jgi:hypothetical protein
MRIDEVNEKIKNGEAQFIETQETQTSEIPKIDDMARLIKIFEMLRRPKYKITTTPTDTPKTYLDQIRFYDDGTNRRLYLYINGTWRYATLT